MALAAMFCATIIEMTMERICTAIGDFIGIKKISLRNIHGLPTGGSFLVAKIGFRFRGSERKLNEF